MTIYDYEFEEGERKSFENALAVVSCIALGFILIVMLAITGVVYAIK